MGGGRDDLGGTEQSSRVSWIPGSSQWASLPGGVQGRPSATWRRPCCIDRQSPSLCPNARCTRETSRVVTLCTPRCKCASFLSGAHVTLQGLPQGFQEQPECVSVHFSFKSMVTALWSLPLRHPSHGQISSSFFFYCLKTYVKLLEKFKGN